MSIKDATSEETSIEGLTLERVNTCKSHLEAGENVMHLFARTGGDFESFLKTNGEENGYKK